MNIPSLLVKGLQQREVKDEVEGDNEETGGAAILQHGSPEVT